MRKFRCNSLNPKKFNINEQSYSIIDSKEKDFIKNYVNLLKFPSSWKKINSKLNKNFGKRDRKRDIKHVLKNELLYSYKKGGSTTIKGGSEKTFILQSIFSSRLLKMIHEGYLVISIDECSF